MNDRLEELLYYHIYKFGITKLDDLYKMIYQGVMGNRHMNLDRMRKCLMDEIDYIKSQNYKSDESFSGSRIIDPLDFLYSFGRINLINALKSDFPVEKIFKMMEDTYDNSISGDKNDLAYVWQQVSLMLKQSGITGKFEDDVDEYGRLLIDKDFPVVHHTTIYKEKNITHYRVIDINCIEQSTYI